MSIVVLRSSSSLAFLLMGAIALGVPCRSVAQGFPTDAATHCAIEPAKIASWFETGSVSLNGAVKPANSVTFPDSPNCSFYEWAEQMFLWLNSPTPGGGGHVFTSPGFFGVSPPDVNKKRTLIPQTSQAITMQVRNAQTGPNDLPLIVDRKGRLMEVQPPRFGPNGGRLLALAPGKVVELGRLAMGANGKPVFFDGQGKPVSPKPGFAELNAKAPGTRAIPPVFKFVLDNKAVFLDANDNVVDVEQGQAGGDSVLMSQQGSLVYYALHVNDVLAYFATAVNSGVMTPAPTAFPTAQPELDKIVAFAQQHSKQVSNPQTLAIELKTSWVEATGLDLSKYVTMTATVPTYDKSDPAHLKWSHSGTKSIQLAMVGMHVVGSTKGHPEMIWATFEHVDNAPLAAYSYLNKSGQVISVPQESTGKWVFAASGSKGPFNVERMSFFAPDIRASNGNTISASDTLRWKAWGAASDKSPNPFAGSPAASNSQVIAANASVIGQLPPGDVRRNYVMTGATWTKPGTSPDDEANQVGTNQLANSTMETYRQSFDTLSNPDNNCFACHTTNTTRVSRIFKGLLPLPLGK